MISTAPRFLDDHFEGLVVQPLKIVLIVLLALLIRVLLHRAINRLTQSTVDSEISALLRPLRERVGNGGPDAGALTERRRQRAEAVASILRSIASITIFAIAAMLVLGELDVNLAPILASAGVLGVAIGFGAQNLIKDFAAGIFMILEDQYGVGDVVDVGEATGSVEAVGLRTTRLRDVDGTVWYVRNGEIIRVGNKSQGYARVVLDMPVPHSADLAAAERAMTEAAADLWQDKEWRDVLLDEPQLLGVEQITDDHVVLRLTVKTRPMEQWRVGRQLRLRVKERLDAARVHASAAEGHLYVQPQPGPTEAQGTPPNAGERPAASTAAGTTAPDGRSDTTPTGRPPGPGR